MKKNKIVIIASVVGISLLSFVGCSSSKQETPNNGVEQEQITDDTATDNQTQEASPEEIQKYDQAATLYESGDTKEQAGDLEGALADYEEALKAVDELLQIDQSEEINAFKAELETRIGNIKSGNNGETNSQTEESSEGESASEESSVE